MADVFKAVENKDVEGLTKLLKEKLDVNKVVDNKTAFYRAVVKYTGTKDDANRKKLLQIMAKLYKAGADVNYIATSQTNSYSESALHHAARSTDFTLIEELMKFKPDVNLKNSTGETPLYSLFRRTKTNSGGRKLVPFQCFELLLKNGADPNSKNKDGVTPFLFAMNTYIWNKDDDMKYVDLFLKQKAKVNIKGFNGNTPLHYAASRSTRGICELLIQNKADVNALNDAGETPLHCSIRLAQFKSSYRKNSYQNYKKACVSYMLLQKGAKILKNSDGELPHFVSNKHPLYDFAAIMEFKGDVISAQDNNENTFLHCLATKSKGDLLDVLNGNATGKKFDFTIKNKDGNTIMDLVKNENWKDAEEVLKKLGATSNSSKTSKDSSKTKSATNTHFDVMISYCHAQKKAVHKVRDYLRQKGLKVWIDEEQMAGNLLEEMGKAVMKSTVIVMCLSPDYEKSANCKREYQFAAKKDKPCVFLKVVDSFEPTEYSLDIMMGMDLYYQIEKKEGFDSSMPRVLERIQTHVKAKQS